MWKSFRNSFKISTQKQSAIEQVRQLLSVLLQSELLVSYKVSWNIMKILDILYECLKSFVIFTHLPQWSLYLQSMSKLHIFPIQIVESKRNIIQNKLPFFFNMKQFMLLEYNFLISENPTLYLFLYFSNHLLYCFSHFSM